MYNNRYKNIFNENADKLKVVNNYKNEKEIANKLKYLCIDSYEKNAKLLKKRKRICNIRFFFKYGLPIIALTLGGVKISKMPNKTDVVPVYGKEVTLVSEDAMLKSFDDDFYYKSDFAADPSSTDVIRVDNLDKKINFQLKCDSKLVSIYFKVGENERLSLDKVVETDIMGYSTSDLEYWNQIDPAPEYRELLEDIKKLIQNNEYFANQKQEINELLENNATEITMAITEYVRVGELSILQSKLSLIFDKFKVFAAIMAIVIAYDVALLYNKKFNYIGGLTLVDDPDNFYEHSVLLDTLVDVRLFAKGRTDYEFSIIEELENNRRIEINNLVKDNYRNDENSQKFILKQ